MTGLFVIAENIYPELRKATPIPGQPVEWVVMKVSAFIISAIITQFCFFFYLFLFLIVGLGDILLGMVFGNRYILTYGGFLG